MIVLRTIFVAQLVLMLPVFAFLLVTPVHLGTVMIYFYLTNPSHFQRKSLTVIR